MKNLLIAASVVGAVAAAAVLYINRNRRRNDSYDVVTSASEAYEEMNRSMKQTGRPAQHAMG